MSKPPTRMQLRGFRSMSLWAQLAWASVVVFAVVLAFIGRMNEGRSGAGLPDDFVQLELGEDVPNELADGRPAATVPPAIAALVDGPVVGARITAADRQACGSGVAWEAAPAASQVAVLPESMVLTVSGAGRADTLGSAFDARGLEPPGDDDPPAGQQGPARSLVVVCEFAPDGRLVQETVGTDELPGGGFSHAAGTTFETRQDVRVPARWSWLLHDRGTYWLAVPVADLEIVRLRWWGEPDDRITMAYSRIILSDGDGEGHTKGWVTQGGVLLGEDW